MLIKIEANDFIDIRPGEKDGQFYVALSLHELQFSTRPVTETVADGVLLTTGKSDDERRLLARNLQAMSQAVLVNEDGSTIPMDSLDLGSVVTGKHNQKAVERMWAIVISLFKVLTLMDKNGHLNRQSTFLNAVVEILEKGGPGVFSVPEVFHDTVKLLITAAGYKAESTDDGGIIASPIEDSEDGQASEQKASNGPIKH